MSCPSIISYPHPVTGATATPAPHQLQFTTSRRTEQSPATASAVSMATCYPVPSYHHRRQDHLASPVAAAAPTVPVQVPTQHQPHKDYSRPLHVDCSVEYELPNAAKPPQGVRNEPLLMIHPCYFRKIESQRRSPFINNLPPPAQQAPATPSKGATAGKRRTARGQQLPQQVPQQAAPYPVHYASWEPPALVPTAATAAYLGGGADLWTADPADHSPDRPCDDPKHHQATAVAAAQSKYHPRYTIRTHHHHRLHPYVSTTAAAAAMPALASTFPAAVHRHVHQQVCYNAV